MEGELAAELVLRLVLADCTVVGSGLEGGLKVVFWYGGATVAMGLEGNTVLLGFKFGIAAASAVIVTVLT